MKHKPKNIEFLFEERPLKEGGVCVPFMYRMQGEPCWCMDGEATDDRIKKFLTEKQYADYKSGKRNHFIVEQSREQAKQAMINSNKGNNK